MIEEVHILLLSLLPLSCMVAFDRDLANTLFYFSINLQSIQQELFTTQHMNIETNIPKGWSISAGSNISRDLSINSDILFMTYADRIQTLANSPIWADYVESEKLQNPPLSYIIVKERTNDFANIESTTEFTYSSYVIEINSTNTSQGLDHLVIFYVS